MLVIQVRQDRTVTLVHLALIVRPLEEMAVLALPQELAVLPLLGVVALAHQEM